MPTVYGYGASGLFVEKLRADFRILREVIEQRLREFRSFDRRDWRMLFAELVFCVLTPQSSARRADKAVRTLLERGLLECGGFREVYAVLRENGVRFPAQKSRYIVWNRRALAGGGRLTRLLGESASETRESLVEEIWGFGYKEASHFLRNIGYTGLAIIDRHIMRCLVKMGLLESEMSVSSRRRYLFVEEKFMEAARVVGVAPEALDLLLWYEGTGEVFK